MRNAYTTFCFLSFSFGRCPATVQDGEVLCYDDVAGHWRSAIVMGATPAQIARVRGAASAR